MGIGGSVCMCVDILVCAVEGRNMSNDCALNRSQKSCDVLRCFTTFYFISVRRFTFVMLNCLIVLFRGIRVTQKANSHFMHLL